MPRASRLVDVVVCILIVQLIVIRQQLSEFALLFLRQSNTVLRSRLIIKLRGVKQLCPCQRRRPTIPPYLVWSTFSPCHQGQR